MIAEAIDMSEDELELLETLHLATTICKVAEAKNRIGSMTDLASKVAEDGQRPISRVHISRIMRGKTNTTLHTAERVARALDVDVNELFDYIRMKRNQEWRL